MPVRGLVVGALALTLAGCGNGTPAWIEEPAIEGGLAATECVPDSGNLSLDRQVAVARARAEIARQYDARIAAMERAWAALERPAPAGDKPQSTFEAVAKQGADPTLSTVAPSRVEYIELDEVQSLCALVSLDRAQARLLYETVVEASGRDVDAAADEALYRAFAGEIAPSD